MAFSLPSPLQLTPVIIRSLYRSYKSRCVGGRNSSHWCLAQRTSGSPLTAEGLFRIWDSGSCLATVERFGGQKSKSQAISADDGGRGGGPEVQVSGGYVHGLPGMETPSSNWKRNLWNVAVDL